LPLLVRVLSEHEELKHQTDLAVIDHSPQPSRPILGPGVCIEDLDLRDDAAAISACNLPALSTASSALGGG
jgi:hypothetical protein